MAFAYNDKTAEIVKKESVYPDTPPREGVSLLPTEYTVYRCPCGKGTVTQGWVHGFGDFWATIDCPDCKDKYDVRLSCGHLWELVPKNDMKEG